MDSLISGSIQEINISPIRLALQLLLVFIVTRLIVWHYEKYGQSILVFFGGLIFAAGVNHFL